MCNFRVINWNSLYVVLTCKYFFFKHELRYFKGINWNSLYVEGVFHQNFLMVGLFWKDQKEKLKEKECRVVQNVQAWKLSCLLHVEKEGEERRQMVFCYQNCSDLLWEKIVLVTKKSFWNSRLKAENLQNFWDH